VPSRLFLPVVLVDRAFGPVENVIDPLQDQRIDQAREFICEFGVPPICPLYSQWG
jgi:hypothetical protein